MFEAMKRIGAIRQLSKALPQHSLITIYKSFVRPHLGYSDIVYEQPNKRNLNQKIERIQYNATLLQEYLFMLPICSIVIAQVPLKELIRKGYTMN